MARKRHSAEEIVNKLRLPDVEMVKGTPVAGVCKLLELTEQTHDRWRCAHYGLAAGCQRGDTGWMLGIPPYQANHLSKAR